MFHNFNILSYQILKFKINVLILNLKIYKFFYKHINYMATNITWYIAIVFVALFLILYLHYIQLDPTGSITVKQINPTSVGTSLSKMI